MNLSAPTTALFVTSLAIALLGLLAVLNVITGLAVPSVWLIATAYAVLAVGCLFKGA
jgi:hypothetical protein